MFSDASLVLQFAFLFECLLVIGWVHWPLRIALLWTCFFFVLYFFFSWVLILSVCRSSLYLWILSLCLLYWKYFPYLLLFHHRVMSNSLRPRGLQHARPSHCSSSPGVCHNSCSLHRWCHPAILSSDALFSFCPWSFPASETFPGSCLFTSDDQNTGALASASVLPGNIHGWFSLRSNVLISLLS